MTRISLVDFERNSLYPTAQAVSRKLETRENDACLVNDSDRPILLKYSGTLHPQNSAEFFQELDAQSRAITRRFESRRNEFGSDQENLLALFGGTTILIWVRFGTTFRIVLLPILSIELIDIHFLERIGI